MAKQIFSTILVGILLGVVIFMAPFFLLKIFLFFLLIGAICRLWWWGGRRGNWRGKGWGGYHYAYADKIRNMSEEEYKAYKEKMDSSCGGYYGCGSYYDNCWGWDKTDKKSETKNETSTNQ